MGTIALGDGHSCAITAEAGVACWGDGADRQVGDPRGGEHLRPRPVAGLADVAALAAGGTTSCALTRAGAVSCWGRLEEGVVGDLTAGTSATPTPVAFAGPVAALELGLLHGCAALVDGTAACWGFNTTEQVGAGPRWVGAPRAVEGGAVAIGAGGGSTTHHSCAVRAGGAAACWGSGRFGQLGDGGTDQRATPTPVSGLAEVVAVALGRLHTCALVADGRVACWGVNGAGQLGDGTQVDRPLPGWVVGLPSPVATHAAGGDTTCATLRAGGVLCWGAHLDSELGGEGSPDRHDERPVAVLGLEDAAEVAVGPVHACARRPDRQLACWGGNRHGQLGDGTREDRSVPVPVAEPR